MTEITVKNFKACKVVSTQGKGFAGITTAFKDSLVFIVANGYKFRKPDGILVYENNPAEVDREEWVYKACIPMKGRPELASTRSVEWLPTITAACLVTRGSYHGQPKVWGRVYQWIHDNGYTPVARGREVYLNDWYSTPPEKLFIEVQVPVIPKDQA
jgi:effector-binding domain-containing protein